VKSRYTYNPRIYNIEPPEVKIISIYLNKHRTKKFKSSQEQNSIIQQLSLIAKYYTVQNKDLFSKS
jgi:hypothetical protein